jgi:hypothetical protein
VGVLSCRVLENGGSVALNFLREREFFLLLGTNIFFFERENFIVPWTQT